MDTMELVRQFHEKFGHPVSDEINIEDDGLNQLRVDLIHEELKELDNALIDQNAVEVLDALLDLQYVLDGAFLALGFAKYKDRGFAEVQASNMSKLGEDGGPIYREDGKILKGPNFFEPNLTKILEG